MSLIGHEDREDKLPKWAAEKMAVLRMKLAECVEALEKERDSGIGGKEPAIIVGETVGGLTPPKLYPLDTRIDFRFGSGLSNVIGVNVIRHRAAKMVLVIRGHDQIAVWPQASNTVEITLDRNF